MKSACHMQIITSPSNRHHSGSIPYRSHIILIYYWNDVINKSSHFHHNIIIHSFLIYIYTWYTRVSSYGHTVLACFVRYHIGNVVLRHERSWFRFFRFLLRLLGTTDLSKLAACCRMAQYRDGDVILREGEVRRHNASDGSPSTT